MSCSHSELSQFGFIRKTIAARCTPSLAAFLRLRVICATLSGHPPASPGKPPSAGCDCGFRRMLVPPPPQQRCKTVGGLTCLRLLAQNPKVVRLEGCHSTHPLTARVRHALCLSVSLPLSQGDGRGLEEMVGAYDVCQAHRSISPPEQPCAPLRQ